MLTFCNGGRGLVICSQEGHPATDIISCCRESFFSILNASFGPTQTQSLEDYIETSIMMQYNNR